MIPHSKRIHGAKNSIADVQGIKIGNYTNKEILSGVTVIVPDERAVAGVDLRGGAPGTRETDVLNPMNLVRKVDSVVLSGGSAFGLSTSDGVMHWLEENKRGFKVKDDVNIPIVPTAILFDINRGKKHGHAESEWGYKACRFLGLECKMGNIGAGTGAIAGGIKGGLGTASETLSNGVTVGAVVVVNSAGYVADPLYGGFYAKHLELGYEFNEIPDLPIKGSVITPHATRYGESTIIGVVATDAHLTKNEASKVAQMAQDGVARAITPAHTMFDGDAIFCLATNNKKPNGKKGSFVSLLGASAADVVSRAIIRGILNAESVNGIISYNERFLL